MKMLAPLVLLVAAPALAAEWPQGLTSARLVPGWMAPDGSYVAGLELTLAPGWKTYWRSPGDAGVPPVFDWSGSTNIAGVTPLWPAPEIFESGGLRTIGYHDGLVLPLNMTLTTPGTVPQAQLSLDLGICHEICVPVHLELSAAFGALSAEPDLLRGALARVPAPAPPPEGCTISPIADGVRVTAELTQSPPPGTLAVLESTRPGVWVSEAELSGATVAADFVPPEARPFDLDPKSVRLTLLTGDGAHEITGCPAK